MRALWKALNRPLPGWLTLALLFTLGAQAAGFLYTGSISVPASGSATFNNASTSITNGTLGVTGAIGLRDALNLDNDPTNFGQNLNKVFLTSDGAAIHGLTLNVPTGSTNGWRFLTNGVNEFQIGNNGVATTFAPGNTQGLISSITNADFPQFLVFPNKSANVGSAHQTQIGTSSGQSQAGVPCTLLAVADNGVNQEFCVDATGNEGIAGAYKGGLTYAGNAGSFVGQISGAGGHAYFVNSGGGAILDVAGNGNVHLTGNGTAGGSLLELEDTTNTTTNPKKFLRANGTNGDLELVNNSYTSTIFSVDDSGSTIASGTAKARTTTTGAASTWLLPMYNPDSTVPIGTGHMTVPQQFTVTISANCAVNTLCTLTGNGFSFSGNGAPWSGLNTWVCSADIPGQATPMVYAVTSSGTSGVVEIYNTGASTITSTTTETVVVGCYGI